MTARLERRRRPAYLKAMGAGHRNPGYRLKRALFALVLLVIPAAVQAAPQLAAADRATVARAEAALNDIRSIESRFIQSSSNGGAAEGKLYVSRPGDLRIDYAPPTPLQVYADGTWLIYLDFELKEASQVPVDATPAAFLVRDRLSLSGDLTVTGVTRRDGRVWLDVVRTEDPDSGRLRLALDAATLSLLGWVVTDAQGVETRITLINPAFNRPIDKRVFVYSPPDWATSPTERPE